MKGETIQFIFCILFLIGMLLEFVHNVLILNQTGIFAFAALSITAFIAVKITHKEYKQSKNIQS